MSEVSYKPEVLEWMEDYKAGLVKPPEPFIIAPHTNDVHFFPHPSYKLTILSYAEGYSEDSHYWYAFHTILRVGEWTDFKEGYKTFGIWDYYLHVRKHAPDSIHDERETRLTIMVNGVFIDFVMGSLYLFTYKKDTQVDYGFTGVNPDTGKYGIDPSVESINKWLCEHWPTKRIPKLLKP